MKKSIFIIVLILACYRINASITEVWPEYATDDTAITMRIYGGGFQSGINDIKLYSPQKPDIAGYSLNIINDHYLECDFNFEDQLTGSYSLIIEGVLQSDTLKTCFQNHHRWIFNTWHTDQVFSTSNNNFRKIICTASDGN